ncbi:hypothetical protein RvY_08450 [Ramazzottius varieornatus]|uniref:Uncharacterized protein n=1 Tax=Ramazzottius varieornatus TaxID=947166 RepID=A0A1D1VBH2_RAMVA|nr:hypothetical protein RvY_08450 [Ramazzottius varieornatus]
MEIGVVFLFLFAIFLPSIPGLKVTFFGQEQYQGSNNSLDVFNNCMDSNGFGIRPNSLKLSDPSKLASSLGNLCVKLWQGRRCTGASYLAIGDKPALTDLFNDTHSVSNCAMGNGTHPPAIWREHWYEHVEDLERVYFDKDIAVYYDSAVDRGITWPFKYIGDIWRYTKQTYGNFSPDNRLFAVLHHGRYHGAHMSTHTSATHDFRTLIDGGVPDDQGWATGPAWRRHEGLEAVDILVNEIGVIVEHSAKGVMGSPARPIWKNVWAELFAFDVFTATGRQEDADRIYSLAIEKKVLLRGLPFKLFESWFYPIYKNYGGAKVMNKFLTLLSENFPKETLGNKWSRYSRDLNYGELVHFWNGATGVNLKNLADVAFPLAYRGQLLNAQLLFPAATYNRTAVDFATATTPAPNTTRTRPPSLPASLSESPSGTAVQLTSQEEGSLAWKGGLIAWGVVTTLILIALLAGVLFVVVRKRRMLGSSGNRMLLREDDLSANM